MVGRASQADYSLIVGKSAIYATQYPRARDWSMSPFNWLLGLPSATRGAVGRRMAVDWIDSLGIPAAHISDGRQRYILVNGTRVQVKTSTLWESGEYRFQQIRDQNYEHVLCLGISPDDVHVWLIPKDVALANLPGQHTGSGAHETHWLHTVPAGSERWLDDYGNQLSDVRDLLRAL